VRRPILFLFLCILSVSSVRSETLYLKAESLCGKGAYVIGDFFSSLPGTGTTLGLGLSLPSDLNSALAAVIPMNVMQRYVRASLAASPVPDIGGFSGERTICLSGALSEKERFFYGRLASFLSDRFLDDNTRMSLESADKVPLNLFDIDDPLTFSFSPEDSSSERAARSYVRVSCASVVKAVSFSLSVRLRFFKEGLVAARSLQTGIGCSASDFFVREVEYRPENGDLLPIDSDFSSLETRYPIPLGSAVKQRDMKNKTLVTAGSLISIVYERNGIWMRMSGYAGLSGALGERIPVTPTVSGKRIFATIVGKGEVAFESR
jgi:flagella basal body P-ring formation protein FlgA